VQVISGKNLFPFFALLASTCFAQFGGQKSFQFLNVPNNARLSALGGVNVSYTDNDINFFFNNPSSSLDSLSGWASAGYLFYVADIGQASFSWSHNFNKIGVLNIGIQHLNYGEIVSYDDSGIEIGSFKSSETALLIGKSHEVGNYRFGANLKMVFSNIAAFRATAMMLDLGGTFIHPSRDLTIGLTFRNLGAVLSEYSGTSDTQLPFDVQLGTTFRPQHMPLRFSITAYNLTKYASYDDPSDSDDNLGTLDKVLGHLNFGAEILLHQNFNILVGYNFLKRQELKTNGTGGGFSVGLAAKIKAFDFAVSRAGYSVGSAGYTLTLSANIEKMIKPQSL
jgi:hypothetical protein